MHSKLCRTVLPAAAAILLAAGFWLAGHDAAAPAQDDPPAPGAAAEEHIKRPAADEPKPRLHAGRPAIEGALDSPATMDFVDTPLVDVAEWLRETYRIPVLLDRRELTDVGVVPAETLVTFRLSDVPLRYALRLMLAQSDLTWTIRHDALLITTPEKAENFLVPRIYDVTDLVMYGDELGRYVADFESLDELIETMVAPDSWPSGTGPSTLGHLEYSGRAVLIIPQTEEVHEEIAKLLDDLRRACAERSKAGAPPRLPNAAAPGAAEGNAPKPAAEQPKPRFHAGRPAIEAALDGPATMEFIEVPLVDVAEWLRETYRIPVLLDRRELTDVGMVPTETLITFRISDVSLRDALRLMLAQSDLTWIIRHDALLITTPEKAENFLVPRIYDVTDLVQPSEDPRFAPDFQSLEDIISITVSPDSWGTGNVNDFVDSEFGGRALILIRQTEEVHEEIAELLDDLRSACAGRSDRHAPARLTSSPAPAPFSVSCIPVVGQRVRPGDARQAEAVEPPSQSRTAPAEASLGHDTDMKPKRAPETTNREELP